MGSIDLKVDVSLTHLLLGVIALSPRKSFMKHTLQTSLRTAAQTYPFLQGLFENYKATDGTAPPEESTCLEDALSTSQRMNLIYEDPAWLHVDLYHICDEQREACSQLLAGLYSEHLLDSIRPIADLVWSRNKKEKIK